MYEESFLKALAKLQKLVHLDLSGWVGFANILLDNVSSLTALQHLDLAKVQVAPVSVCTHESSPCSASDLSLPRRVESTRLTTGLGVDITYLSPCCAVNQVSGKLHMALPSLTALTQLELGETWIRNDDLRSVSGLRSLQHLGLIDTWVDDAGRTCLLPCQILHQDADFPGMTRVGYRFCNRFTSFAFETVDSTIFAEPKSTARRLGLLDWPDAAAPS